MISQGSSVQRILPPRLLAISSGRLGHLGEARSFGILMERMVEAGLKGILLREPHATDGRLLALAEALRGLGIQWIGIHDRAHLALSPHFDGVHLGFRSLSPRKVRGLVPPEVSVGFSAHRSDDLALVEADYIFYSPVFPPTSKPAGSPLLGLDGLQQACRTGKRPALWGLGGITAANAESVLACGADGVAVLGGIFDSPDPAHAVGGLLEAIGD